MSLFTPNLYSTPTLLLSQRNFPQNKMARKRKEGKKYNSNSLLSSQGCQTERIRHAKLKTTGSSQKLKPRQPCTARCITLIFARRCSHSSLWFLSFVPHTSIDPSCRLKTHKSFTHSVHPWDVLKHFLMNSQTNSQRTCPWGWCLGRQSCYWKEFWDGEIWRIWWV